MRPHRMRWIVQPPVSQRVGDQQMAEFVRDHWSGYRKHGSSAARSARAKKKTEITAVFRRCANRETPATHPPPGPSAPILETRLKPPIPTSGASIRLRSKYEPSNPGEGKEKELQHPGIYRQ